MEQTLCFRSISGVAAVIAFCLSTTPALADTFITAPSKNEAILGGPSSLAAIIAAQTGGAAAPLVASAAMPTSFGLVRPAILAAPAAPIVSLAASPISPDVFNSVAMRVNRTALDARWDRVKSAPVHGTAARFAAGLRGHDERVRLEAINKYVNARVAFTDDSRQFGVDDRWSAPSETLARGRGDCEDYALAKLAMLRQAGFAERDLYFVVLKDLVRRADHAVLVVRSAGRFMVLDNGTDRLLDSATLIDYRPVLTFSAGQRFAHGYRRPSTPRVILASSEVSQESQAPILTAAGLPSSPFASR